MTDSTAPPETTILYPLPSGRLYPMNGSLGSTETWIPFPTSNPAFLIISMAAFWAFATRSFESPLGIAPPSECSRQIKSPHTGVHCAYAGNKMSPRERGSLISHGLGSHALPHFFV